MTLVTMIAAGILLVGPNDGAPVSASPMVVQAETQQSAQDASQAKPSQSQQAPAATSKPCSDVSQSGSPSKSDCKAAKPKAKKKHTAHNDAKAADAGPSKTVVRNGGTGEPSVAISAGESQKQAARQMEETNRLLAAADLNLKDVAVRGLNASQQATVKQIRSYMDEAKAAANSGDMERAYNLANKANMLAADLNAR